MKVNISNALKWKEDFGWSSTDVCEKANVPEAVFERLVFAGNLMIVNLAFKLIFDLNDYKPSFLRSLANRTSGGTGFSVFDFPPAISVDKLVNMTNAFQFMYYNNS